MNQTLQVQFNKFDYPIHDPHYPLSYEVFELMQKHWENIEHPN